MDDIIVGKHVLESLSLGMYSNSFDIFREYIQNATDAIDCAYYQKILSNKEGEITIDIAKDCSGISIKDNGIGISSSVAVKKLCDIGNSDKNYDKSRGFRGIGRLGGLGYADALYFKTSSFGENKRTIIKWDCIKLRELLSPSNTEQEDIIGVIKSVMSYYYEDEKTDLHYFEVILENINEPFKSQYTDEAIDRYISSVAPVDFDSQHFPLGSKIKEHFEEEGYSIPVYRIIHVRRNKPIYKPYSRSLTTGLQRRTQTKDYVKSIEYVSEHSTDGHPLYIGWLAITDFSGQIKDETLQGIRLRKGNILVGDNSTFSRFFPSEGAVANKMFAGEIYILHPDIIPNAKRDDFEPGHAYQELFDHLSKWAEKLNHEYRRGTSKVTSAIRALDKAASNQREIESKIDSGVVTSDTKRDKLLSDLDKTSKAVSVAKKELDAALRKGNVATEKEDIVRKKLTQADKIESFSAKLGTKIVNADYATKGDLPTSYSKSERKIYQRIIEVIDRYFQDEPEISGKLRDAIKTELSSKKK